MEEKNVIEIKNKRAEYEYFLLDDYTAGIVLTGTEIKSIRDGKANLTDAYCTFIGNELFVRQMHISEYRFGSYLNHAAKRDRKLLLNKRELHKLQNKIKERGFTIIPVMLFVNPQGRANSLSRWQGARNSTTNVRASKRKTPSATCCGSCANPS